MKLINKYLGILFIIIGLIFNGCKEDFLDRQPLDEVSEATFWKTEEDARLALNGVYERDGMWRDAEWIARELDCNSDNANLQKPSRSGLQWGTFSPTDGYVSSGWNGSYDQISKCNTFLENVVGIEMNEDLKDIFIAEVRFFRAWEYYNLVQWFGSVPLVKKELTMDEANNVTSDSKDDIVEFILNELDAAIPDLPKKAAEHGRVERGAAYAVKGRLLMSEKRWSEAITAYENLIDLDEYSIDPDYRSLFDGSNEQSSEIIFTSKYLKDEISHSLQLVIRPNADGGWNHTQPTKGLVDSYLCDNGETIEENATYQNADNFHEEFVNEQGGRYRDSRLYYSIYIDGIHTIGGQTFYGHPDSTQSGDQIGENPGMSGYACRKWVDEDYEGNLYTGGNDVPIIRYAEVLLSYLESKIKAGDPISQELLDNTINKLRTRESVDMPPVNRGDYGDAMDLWENCVKRERRIELAFEGLRLWDLIRWGEDDKLIGSKHYGMKITENPEGYDEYRVNDEGYVYVMELGYKDFYHPWPIPQDELDINPNLEQKENWKGR